MRGTARKRPVIIDWYKFDNLEGLKGWVENHNGDTFDSNFRVKTETIHKDLEYAKEWYREALYADQIHGEPEFESMSEIETVYTEEGVFELHAAVEWNRHDKMYYFIETINLSVEELEGEEAKLPDPDIFVKTLEGSSYKLTDGVIVIRGVEGEYYLHDAELFEKVYEIIEKEA